MKKKILIASNTLWTITNFRKNLIKELVKNRVDVVCVASIDHFSDESERILKECNAKFIKVNLARKSINPFREIRLLYDLYKIYKNESPDIILHYTVKLNIYGTLAAAKLKIPSINTVNGLGSRVVSRGVIEYIVKILYKFSLRFSSAVFFQNKDDLKYFQNNNLLPKMDINLVPGSGIDTNYFKSNIKKKNNEITFLLIARLLKEKGIFQYIEAAKIILAKYENIKFQLLGFFDYDNPSFINKAEVEQWIDNDIISYLGTTDDVRSFIAASDCIVLPSYYREGIPRSLLEAASMEKPIITTDSVGCREVVEDEVNGYLCNPKDHKDLAEKMEKMIQLPLKKRLLMGKKGREKVIHEFDKKIVINRYIKVIRNILNK